MHEVIQGDCVAVMAAMDAESVDAIVTDPPYELGFMQRAWDSTGVTYQVGTWRACFDALKPGGHLLAFGGARTYHRMACAIEDAGFEIRDQIMWLYGSGFPKSLDISKAIDRKRDDLVEIYRVTNWIRSAREASGISNADIDGAFGFHGMAGHWTSGLSQPAVPRLEWMPKLLAVLGDPAVPEEIADLLVVLNDRKGTPGEAWFRREVVGRKMAVDTSKSYPVPIAAQGLLEVPKRVIDLTAPATAAAQEWEGWGTALKPAHEPIVVARKPLIGTVASNVQAHGTGAINVDGCRVGADVVKTKGHAKSGTGTFGDFKGIATTEHEGRWPANVVLDESAGAVLDEQSGVSTHRRSGERLGGVWNGKGGSKISAPGDSGGASRFFYCPKASRDERELGCSGERVNVHPTVKPVDLMRYLIRLVTPPGGTVLDPFLGSGTTLMAAALEGFDAIGIEREAEYVEIAKVRVAEVERQIEILARQGTLDL